jgi:N-acetylglutamate synthase-like GNAT family acetyltransferase
MAKGNGKKILNDFVEHCRSIGIKKIFLESISNDSTKKFYEKFGFTVANKYEYTDSEKDTDCYEYEYIIN